MVIIGTDKFQLLPFFCWIIEHMFVVIIGTDGGILHFWKKMEVQNGVG